MRRVKLDYFPFFPKDAEADEAICRMDDAQLGFWLRCIMRQWPNGSIPADPEELCLVLSGRATGGGFRTPDYVSSMLLGPVGLRMSPVIGNPGRLADPRLLSEAEIARSEAEKNSRNRKSRSTTVSNENNEVGSTTVSNDPLFCSVSVSVLNTSSNKKENDEDWEAFMSLYPAIRLDTDLAYQAWISREDGKRILAGLRSRIGASEWKREDGRFVPKASRFIADGLYLALVKPDTAAALDTMDPETRKRLEAIRDEE